MKINSQDLFTQGIDEAGIEELQQLLKDGGVPQNRIDEILMSLKEGLPSTAPELPEVPLLPEEPAGVLPTKGIESPETGLDTTKEVLKPGKSLRLPEKKASLRICASDFENMVEDVVEDLMMGSGMDPEIARSEAVDMVVDHFADLSEVTNGNLKNAVSILGQLRERKGPAQHTMFGGTLYDQLMGVIGEFEDVEIHDPTQDVNTITDMITQKLDEINLRLEGIEEDPANADIVREDIRNMLETVRDEVNNLGGEAMPVEAHTEEAVMTLQGIADEVKQVGLDTQYGTTSPIDLGDWLY